MDTGKIHGKKSLRFNAHGCVTRKQPVRIKPTSVNTKVREMCAILALLYAPLEIDASAITEGIMKEV
jgi:hypothetical protein